MAEERQQRRGGGGRGRGKNEDRDSYDKFDFESTIQIKRCAAVVKGGRRFSFNALVVIGDRKGNVGVGYAKATEVPPAIDKAVKRARRNITAVALRGRTLPHQVIGRYGAARVVMLPAAPGTGVIAGRGVRDVMVAAGIADVLTKNLGSTNPMNVVKATIAGLKKLRTRDQVALLRGVTL